MKISYELVVCLIGTLMTIGKIGATSSNEENSGREKSSDYSNEQLAGYRFGDEFFNHPSAETAEATETEVSGLKSGKKPDNCERVVKDSMICMICKEPNTNSKYEQCSYVARPRERGQSYSNSRSYSGKPRENEEARTIDGNEDEEKEVTPYGRYNEEEEEEEDDEEAYGAPEKYSQGEDDDDDDDGGDDDDDDSGKYEERESSPSSLFRSNVYENNEGRKNTNEEFSEDEEPANSNERVGQSSYESSHRRAPNSKINKENSSGNDRGNNDDEPVARNRSTKNKKRAGKCREIKKNSMTCIVCTDPENGGNSEKCSYSHQPNDKLYKFSKSKRFGYPSTETAADQPEETKQISDVVQATSVNPHCRQVRKNDKIVCTVCKDTKTGESSEECEYSTKSPTRRS